MIHTIWTLICYQPLYNALLFFISIVPKGDVGLAVILLTIVVKLVLFPLTQKSINAQLKMKMIEPQLAQIKQSNTDKAEQSRQTMALYKQNNINPFSSCLVVLIQLPVIIALYTVFIHGFGTAPVAAYSFIHVPAAFNLQFLGILDLAKKSLLLAVLAGAAQFVQGYLAQGRMTKPTGTDMQSEFSRSLQTQMLYILPLVVIYPAYRFSAAVALYWITSNIFTVGQELYTRRKMRAQGTLIKKAKIL